MPQIIAFIVAASAEAVFAVTGSAAIATAVATVVDISAYVATVALTVSELFQPTPRPEAIRDVARQAIPPRRRGGGTARLGGFFLVDYATAKNQLFRIVACVDGPVTNITRRYLAQDLVTISGGMVQKLPNGAYDNDVAWAEALGVAGVNAFPTVSAAVPEVWPTTASGTGIFMLYTGMFGGARDKFETHFPRNKATPSVVGKVGVAYDWRDLTQSQTDTTTWKNTSNPVVGLVSELFRYRGYDWTKDFLPAIDILTDEADRCDAPIGRLNVLSETMLGAQAGANHVVVDAADPDPPAGVSLFIGGQTFTVTSTSLVTGGRQINFSGGTLAAFAPKQSTVRWQASVAHPLTEPTYAFGGVWNATDDEATVVKMFLEAMDGFMMRRPGDGAVVIRCGHYEAPTVTIGPDEVISYTWEPNLQYGKAITELAPAFVAPAYDYNQTETTLWRDDAAVAKYGLNSQPFRPALVQSNGQVRRLAKRRLSHLLAHVETMTFKLSAIRALGERFIRVQMGDTEPDELADIVLEIVGKPRINAAGLSITFPVAPADVTIDAWDPYTDEGNGPADTSPGPGSGFVDVAAPTIISAVPFIESINSGTTGNGQRLSVTLRPPTEFSDVAELTWEVRWQVSGAVAWTTEAPAVNDSTGDFVFHTGFTPTDLTIVLEARYHTGARISEWSADFTAERIGGGTLDFRIPGNPLSQTI